MPICYLCDLLCDWRLITVAVLALVWYVCTHWVNTFPRPRNYGSRVIDTTTKYPSRAARLRCPNARYTRARDVIDTTAAAARLRSAVGPATHQRYLIVGVGFLGSHVVETLLARGETDITLFDRQFTPFATQQWGSDSRVRFVRGDVANEAEVDNAFGLAHSTAGREVSVVISTAAFVSYYQRLAHQYHLSEHVNVRGTRTLLAVAKRRGVSAYLHVSSSHVCMDHNVDYECDESFPYAEAPFNHYTPTKTIAEREVLAASTPQFATVAVRPCSGIFGPRDGAISADAVKLGEFRAIGHHQFSDSVYVKNVVLGMLLCERALLSPEKRSACSGLAYNISNNEPLTFAEFRALFTNLCPSLKVVAIPWPVSWALAFFAEAVQFVFRGRVSLGSLDMLTPPVMHIIDMDYTFSSKRAQQLLGYEPAYDMQEGAKETLAYYRDLATGQLLPEK